MVRCLFLTLSCIFGLQVTSSQQVADSAEMIKTITGIPNVTLIPNDSTALRLFGTGESYTHFSLAVPEKGFKYYVETTLTPEMEIGPLGWITFQFDYPKSLNRSIIFYIPSKWLVSYRTYNEKDVHTKALIFEVHPDGLVTGYPPDYVAKLYFPPLNTLPAFGNGKRILKVRISWRELELPFFLKFPWSVRFLTRESTTSTAMTTEMPTETPTTIEPTEDSLTLTSNNPFFRDKWWLIVNIGTTFVVVSSVLSAFLIYKSFCLRTSSNSDNVSTTTMPQTSKVSNANSVAITSEDPANRPPAMPES